MNANTLRGVGAGLALTMAVSCSGGGEQQQTIHEKVNPDTWSVPTEAVPASPDSALEAPGSELVHSLFEANAPVKVIFLPTPEADAQGGIPYRPGQAPDQKLKDGDPATLNSILFSLSAASEGRYHPRHISVAVAPETPISDCIDFKSLDQAAQIQQLAQPFENTKELNLIFIDGAPCVDTENDGSTIEAAGYASTETTPVLDDGALGRLAKDIAHEVGHEGGLAHAATETCLDPTEIVACVTDQTADPLSVMGYQDGPVYTAPELAGLDLLKPSEIISSPKSGDYVLADPSDISDPKIAKLMTIPSQAGNIFFSWEKDPQAAYDINCKPIKSYAGANGVSSSDFLHEGELGSGKRYVCYKINERPLDHSLQVRQVFDSDGMAGFQEVVRPDRSPNSFFSDLSNGEVTPGTVVYSDASVTVTLKGFGANDTAIVHVELIK